MSIPESPMRDLKGRVYIVTGASRGIGLSVAHALARRGAKIGMLARSEAELKQRAEEIGPDALAVAVDAASKVDVTRAIDQVVAHFGSLDGIVNNAGVSCLAPVIEMEEADLRMMLDLNLMGALFAMQAAVPHLRAAGGGNIINVTSPIASRRDEFTHMGGYAASKAALERLSEEARDELKHEAIAVSMFRPGATVTYVGANWSEEKFGRALGEWMLHGELCDGAMTPALVGEAIVRMLETPPGAAYDMVELRPNVPSPRRPMQANLDEAQAAPSDLPGQS